MPLRLQKKATRVVRAVVEEVNVARGVGTRTDKRGNAKTSLWDHGKVRAFVWIGWMFFFVFFAFDFSGSIRFGGCDVKSAGLRVSREGGMDGWFVSETVCSLTDVNEAVKKGKRMRNAARREKETD